MKRSHEEQERKFNAGLSKARGGQSQHQFLKAIDLEFFKDGKWLRVPDTSQQQDEHRALLQMFGDFWESLDAKNRWGGNFKAIYDPNHFERGK